MRLHYFFWEGRVRYAYGHVEKMKKNGRCNADGVMIIEKLYACGSEWVDGWTFETNECVNVSAILLIDFTLLAGGRCRRS